MAMVVSLCALPQGAYVQTISFSRRTDSPVVASAHRNSQQILLHPIPGTKVLYIRRATTSGGGETSGSDNNPMRFLSLEEAGLIEMTNLDLHEKFLARLTVSSLNLLRVISEQENVAISDLNAGKLCDWFVKDKAKRKENINSAVLKWDSGHGPGW